MDRNRTRKWCLKTRSGGDLGRTGIEVQKSGGRARDEGLRVDE